VSSSFGWGDFPLLGDQQSNETRVSFLTDLVKPSDGTAATVSEAEDDSLVDSDLSTTTENNDDDANVLLGRLVVSDQEEERRKVSFDKVHVRVHSVVLGDHAWASGGYPLALGWDYDNTDTYEVDDYERDRHRTVARHDVRKLSATARHFKLVALTGGSLLEVSAQERARQAATDREDGCGEGILRHKDSFPRLRESYC
jgi:hypothetical protein